MTNSSNLEVSYSTPLLAQTLIYLTDKRDRDFIANYFHSQLILLADFSHSGAQENKKDQAELARLKERFKRPAGAAPVAGKGTRAFRDRAVSSSMPVYSQSGRIPMSLTSFVRFIF